MEISAPIPSTTTVATVSPTVPPYSLPPGRFMNEDILFCVDIDVESKTELKLMNTRLDVMKHAILFFVNAKHSICPDHRFCFSILSETFSWVGIPGFSPLYFVHQLGFSIFRNKARCICCRVFYFYFYFLLDDLDGDILDTFQVSDLRSDFRSRISSLGENAV